jgi:thiamine-phosphate pyrophosphorylase
LLLDDQTAGLKFSLPKIYPITDRELSGLSHTELVRQFVGGGARLVQLRDKSAPSGDFYEDARTAVAIARSNGVIILINDRVDIALMTGADGVHLGQDDLPAAEARRLLGERAIIGVSTHTVEQASQVSADRTADYIAFGPIFETRTKPDHEALVGVEKLREIRTRVGDIPLVAIGGINCSDLAQVLSSGADSAAMISEFYAGNTTVSEQFRKLSAAADRIN